MQFSQYARMMRHHPTPAEQLLWQHLRRKQIAGYRFRRQVVIEPYIVDFICFEAKLVIEVDGGQHQQQLENDRLRDEYLVQHGYTVLRFWNNQVLTEIDGVLEKIRLYLITPPQPSPCRGGGDHNPARET